MKIDTKRDLQGAVQTCERAIDRIKSLEQQLDESTRREIALSDWQCDAVGLLMALEWRVPSRENCCPSCACERAEGHKDDCEIKFLLGSRGRANPKLSAIFEALGATDVEAALDRIVWRNEEIERLGQYEDEEPQYNVQVLTHGGTTYSGPYTRSALLGMLRRDLDFSDENCKAVTYGLNTRGVGET
jgi:DNA repair exonuclease SbcCD ATPase subunit